MSQKNNDSVQVKIAKLRELSAWFDGDEFELEKALDVYKEAEALALEVETDLNSLKNDIQVIKKKFDTETA